MRYAVSVLMLGYTRLSGLVAYNSESREFEEITPAIARNMIEHKQIKGVKWKNNDDGGEFVVDTEGFNQQDIPIKTAVGKFRSMVNDNGSGLTAISMYSVVRVLETDYRGRLYEVVSNKCARVKIAEENLIELTKITNVAGVIIEDNHVVVCDGVEFEDRRQSAKETAVEAKIETMDDVFYGGVESETEPVNSDEDDMDKKETSDKTKSSKKSTRSQSKKSATTRK